LAEEDNSSRHRPHGKKNEKDGCRTKKALVDVTFAKPVTAGGTLLGLPGTAANENRRHGGFIQVVKPSCTENKSLQWPGRTKKAVRGMMEDGRKGRTRGRGGEGWWMTVSGKVYFKFKGGTPNRTFWSSKVLGKKVRRGKTEGNITDVSNDEQIVTPLRWWGSTHTTPWGGGRKCSEMDVGNFQARPTLKTKEKKATEKEKTY